MTVFYTCFLKYAGPIVLLAIFMSCRQNNQYLSRVETTLSMAGHNRVEIEKVLHHYSIENRDSLKLKAAYYLIENMAGASYLKSAVFETFSAVFKSLAGVLDPARAGLLHLVDPARAASPRAVDAREVRARVDFVGRRLRRHDRCGDVGRRGAAGLADLARVHLPVPHDGRARTEPRGPECHDEALATEVRRPIDGHVVPLPGPR